MPSPDTSANPPPAGLPATRARTDAAARLARSRWLLPLGLFVLAPLIGEFLLGNQPISALPWLFFLAPVYGGGAILARETARRAGTGWYGIILLAAAFALLLEGIIHQMLFNPAYLGLPSFAGFAPLPLVGMSGTLLQGTLTLHVVWSICVPIALMEAFDPTPGKPWLDTRGLVLVGGLFVAGSLVMAAIQYETLRFIATPGQFAAIAVAIIALVALALRPPRWSRSLEDAAALEPAPSPLRVGAVAFVLSSLYWAIDQFMPVDVGDWGAIGLWLALAAISALLLIRASRRPGWGGMHRLAVAGGALLTYVWAGFVHSLYLGVPRQEALLGNSVFGAGAIILLALAIRAQWSLGQRVTPAA
ncbi:MAG: hypothetical protein QM692_18530 [Thermomicrobiales bacterium]